MPKPRFTRVDHTFEFDAAPYFKMYQYEDDAPSIRELTKGQIELLLNRSIDSAEDVLGEAENYVLPHDDAFDILYDVELDAETQRATVIRSYRRPFQPDVAEKAALWVRISAPEEEKLIVLRDDTRRGPPMTTWYLGIETMNIYERRYNPDEHPAKSYEWFIARYPNDGLPLYVNVYSTTREYGGPEEGGWYYDCRECIATEFITEGTEEEKLKKANELARRYTEEYAHLSHREHLWEMNAVQISVLIEFSEGQSDNSYFKPRYE